jgi:hypothetical protein
MCHSATPVEVTSGRRAAAPGGFARTPIPAWEAFARARAPDRVAATAGRIGAAGRDVRRGRRSDRTVRSTSHSAEPIQLPVRFPATKAEGKAVAQAGRGPVDRRDRWRRVVGAADGRPVRRAPAKSGTAGAALLDHTFLPEKPLSKR